MPRYILALDQGTTSSRAILFDEQGAPVAQEQREFPQHLPAARLGRARPRKRSGRRRSSPRRRSSATPASGSRQIAAIGITNQRETTVVWDRATGEPIANAIVWQCRRTAAMCDELRDRASSALVRERTGLVIDAYFSATKVRWLLDNVPARSAAPNAGELAFGTVDSWLIYRTHRRPRPRHRRDERVAHDALRPGHGALGRRAAAHLQHPRVDAARRCRLQRRHRAVRRVAVRRADPDRGHRGRPAGRALRPGLLSRRATRRTPTAPARSCSCTRARRRPRPTSCSPRSPRASAASCSTRSKAASSSPARPCSGCATASASSRTRRRSKRSRRPSDSGGVYLVPAFVGLGAPHWDPYARGAIVGLTRGTTAAHIARADARGDRVPDPRRARSDGARDRHPA